MTSAVTVGKPIEELSNTRAGKVTIDCAISAGERLSTAMSVVSLVSMPMPTF